jgi:hypothetical protein
VGHAPVGVERGGSTSRWARRVAAGTCVSFSDDLHATYYLGRSMRMYLTGEAFPGDSKRVV